MGLMGLMGFMGLTLSSCSDEPDSENFYTFTGEMMSDYLRGREQFSEFTEIVQRAGLMDLLSTYGHYTCFVPSNEAVNILATRWVRAMVSQSASVNCDRLDSPRSCR